MCVCVCVFMCVHSSTTLYYISLGPDLTLGGRGVAAAVWRLRLWGDGGGCSERMGSAQKGTLSNERSSCPSSQTTVPRSLCVF